jgi:phage-related protein
LVEPVDSKGTGSVSGFLAGLGANKRAHAAGMVRLFDRAAARGPRLGTAKCHQIDGEIWELINGSIRVLFVHDGDRMLLLTHSFVKSSQKTPRKEINRAKRVIADYRAARESDQLEWVNDQETE